MLAACRAGITEVILPAGNQRDLRDVPEDVREGMTFHYVERMDRVFDLALRGEPRAVRDDPPISTPLRGAFADDRTRPPGGVGETGGSPMTGGGAPQRAAAASRLGGEWVGTGDRRSEAPG